MYRPDGTLHDPEELPLQRAAATGEEVRDVEVVHRAADGREFVGVFSASALRDADGNVIGAVAVGRDVTAERQAQAERERLVEQVMSTNALLTVKSLQARENAERAERQAQQMSALLAGLDEAVTVMDSEGHIVLRNQAAEAMTGRSSQEAQQFWIEQPMVLLRPDGTPVDSEDRPANRALRGEHFADVEMVMVRDDGTRRRALFSGTGVRDAAGQVALALLICAAP